MEDVRINSDRLWASLMEMARIGGTPAGRVCRLALTDLARESRDVFNAWCEEVGCATHFDAAGNIFARRSGADDGGVFGRLSGPSPAYSGTVRPFAWAKGRIRCRFHSGQD